MTLLPFLPENTSMGRWRTMRVRTNYHTTDEYLVWLADGASTLALMERMGIDVASLSDLPETKTTDDPKTTTD